LINKYVSSGAWVAALALIISGIAAIPAVAGITAPAVTMMTTGATAVASATGLASSGLGGIVNLTTQMFGSILNNATMMTTLTSGSTGALVGGVALLSMMPPDYSTIVKEMLDYYFKNIKVSNPEIIQKTDEQLEKAFPKVDVPIHKLIYQQGVVTEKEDGIVNTNILAILKQLKVSSYLEGKVEDQDAVLEKFNRFMCKYDIMNLVEWRIAKLYAEEETKYKPSQLLRFILNDSMP